MIRAIFAPASCVLFGVGLTVVLPAWAAWATVPYSLFFLFDTALRYRDYRRLCKQRTFPMSAIKRHRYSFCQRQVCLAAASEFGLDYWIVDEYYMMGYRWYHIFPDGFPSCLANKRWWKSFLKG
jgi:hypothetical protein